METSLDRKVNLNISQSADLPNVPEEKTAADGTAKARSAKLALETFSPEVKTAALALGYFPKELPRLARAAHFYAQAMGGSEMDAMRAVAEPCKATPCRLRLVSPVPTGRWRNWTARGMAVARLC